MAASCRGLAFFRRGRFSSKTCRWISFQVGRGRCNSWRSQTRYVRELLWKVRGSILYQRLPRLGSSHFAAAVFFDAYWARPTGFDYVFFVAGSVQCQCQRAIFGIYRRYVQPNMNAYHIVSFFAQVILVDIEKVAEFRVRFLRYLSFISLHSDITRGSVFTLVLVWLNYVFLVVLSFLLLARKSDFPVIFVRWYTIVLCFFWWFPFFTLLMFTNFIVGRNL